MRALTDLAISTVCNLFGKLEEIGIIEQIADEAGNSSDYPRKVCQLTQEGGLCGKKLLHRHSLARKQPIQTS